LLNVMRYNSFSTVVVDSADASTVGPAAALEPGTPAADVLAGAGAAAGWVAEAGALCEELAAALGETVGGLFFARKYCKPKKTVTRTSIMTSSDRLSPPPC
jgi:hypothetical protein